MDPSHDRHAQSGMLSMRRLVAPASDSRVQTDHFERCSHTREHLDLTERLREFRQGRTYVEIAARLKMSRETLRRYFSGDRPSAVFLIVLCREYNLSPAWLMLGEGPMYAWSSDPPRAVAGRP